MAEVTGTVVRLQVQRSPLKPGDPLTRVYDSAPIVEVVALEVTERGVVGLTGDGSAGGGRLVDVHHADHPRSRSTRLSNGISLLSLADYAALREAYGPHLADGIAGETLLVDGDLAGDGDLLLETVDGEPLRLTEVHPAAPCAEFTRFCLGRGPGDTGPEVRAALQALAGGARGLLAGATGQGTVERGARLLRA